MDHTKELIALAHEGNKEARDMLVMHNMGLVYSIAKRFANRGYEMDDIVSIGTIGLIKAIDKFDLNMDVMLSTYAVPMISGEIKRFIRDDGIIICRKNLKERQPLRKFPKKRGSAQRILSWQWRHQKMLNQFTRQFTKAMVIRYMW